ncbi:MAG: double zinc ribbon domain-containing protein [Elusimicrobiales bacterium]
MSAKPSVIKCPKCGYQPNIISDTCLQCGAKLEKACGECGFANAVEKNYCDQCGALLALQPPHKADLPPPPPAQEEKGGFTLEMESIQDTVNERATSFRRRPSDKPAPPPAPAPAPAPAQEQPKPQAAQPPAGRPPAAKVPLSARASSPFSPDSSRLLRDSSPKTQPSAARRMAGPAFTALLVGILLTILYMIVAPSIPRLRLLMTAKSYLTDISQGKFEKAYELLSTNSKANITQENYVKNSREYYAKAPAWQFKDVQIYKIGKEAAMVVYQLKEGDGEWKQDYISFINEHGRWTRPYIWILFHPIDEALNRQDFPQALFLAQKLYLTDPVDPRSSGYLCAAEYFMGLYEKSMESCKRTIDSAEVYPVGYSSEELFWYSSYYADSLRYLQRDRVALSEYEKLMKWPGLTSKEQCPLFLNRADSYVNLKDYERALQDIMKAEVLCSDNQRGDAKKRLLYLSGGAGKEAVEFAQKSRFQPNMPPIAETRRRQIEALKARVKNPKLLPKDQWLGVHVAGPEYRVFLRQEQFNPQTGRSEAQNVYVFLINLWSGKAKVEKAPAPPPAGAAH